MGDLVFRGRRQVVVVEGERDFAPFETADGKRAYLHGSLFGEDRAALRSGARFGDLFGRFLLLLHDPEQNRLEIHGDRHGFLPFYQASSEHTLHLSTRIGPLIERKAVVGRLDAPALSDFLAFGWTFGEKTLVSGVSCLEAGVGLTIDLDDLSATTAREWDASPILREERLPLDRARDDLTTLFLEGVEKCLGESKDIAITLSGGIDTRCLLAAVLHLGRTASAYHVGVPGSRAERYARRIAEQCGIPLHAHLLDADFATRYHELLREVVELTDGMKFVPQVEMLWLRDQVALPTLLLHGAYGEISKLRVLRDFRFDATVLGADRASLPDLLWTRFAARFGTCLEIFSEEFRQRIEPHARANLCDAVERLEEGLGVPELLQVCYFREFPKAARYGHLIWNQRVPTRHPFIYPPYVDLLLRVRNEDRMEQEFQKSFLKRVAPMLHALPDENTGVRADAPPWVRQLIRLTDQARIALFDSKVDAGHGDLLAWIDRMQPTPEEIVSASREASVYDTARIARMIERVRESRRQRGLSRARFLRTARREAVALQAFFLLEAWRRSMQAFGAISW